MSFPLSFSFLAVDVSPSLLVCADLSVLLLAADADFNATVDSAFLFDNISSIEVGFEFNYLNLKINSGS